jgi:hypothetical protein
MNLSEERAARNEALFREVNEQVERDDFGAGVYALRGLNSRFDAA